jgi:hypothetical protein
MMSPTSGGSSSTRDRAHNIAWYKGSRLGAGASVVIL